MLGRLGSAWTRHWQEVGRQLRALDRVGACLFGAVLLALVWPGIACLWMVSRDDSPMAGWPALLFGVATTASLLLLTARVWINLLLILPLVLFQPVEWYAVHTYHSQVSPAMFAVFALTNVGEASDYLTDRWPVVVAGIAACLTTIGAVGWTFWKRRLTVPLRLRLSLTLPALAAAGAVAVWQAQGLRGVLVQAAAAPCTGSAVRLAQMIGQRAEVGRMAQQRAGFRHGATSIRRDEPQLVILIIGESLRAGNLQLNGYQRPTTPLLARREGLITLPDVVACGHLTTQALPPALTGSQPDDQARMNRCSSLVGACAEAGFATWWLSNQAPIGRWDELVSSYAHEADVVRWMNPAPLVSEWGKVTVYDDKMLAAAAEVLGSLPEKALVVLHMQGSHLRYELRYRPGGEVFLPAAIPGAGENYREHPDRMRNAYDNSVAMTDAFIDACIALHQRSGRAGFVMFVADHGESLLDDARGFQGHGNLPPPEVELRVPWLIWPSAVERNRHPEPWDAVEANRQRKASTRDLFQTLLHLAGVAIREADPRRSLASPAYQEQPRLLVDSWGRPLDFDRDIAR